MTNEQIDHLIAARSRMTDRRDEQIDNAAVDLIDVMLRDVPPGQRNDVDLLLGRMCASLPTNADMVRIAAEAMQNQPPIEY